MSARGLSEIAVMQALAAYRSTRREAVRVVVVHTDEGGEVEGGALALAHYLQRPAAQRRGSRGGYHETVDSRDFVVCAADFEVVNGAAGANEYGWHLCVKGYAHQTRADWDDPYSRAELSLAAARVRAACDRLGVPARKIDAAALRRNERGICGHADVTAAFGESTHTDPGSNFPWATFVALVHGPLTAPEGDDDVPKPVMVHPEKRLPDRTLPTVLTEYGSRQGTKLDRAEAQIQADSGVETLELPMSLWRLMVVR